MEDCLFCKIVAGEIPASIIFQGQEIMAFKDINPQAPVHILLISRRHIASMDDLSQEDGPLLTDLFLAAKKIAQETGLTERGYRFVTNIGKDGGQSVPHLHFHLLGGRQFGWPPG